MSDKIVFSHLPESWGGPFIWSPNERGNLTFVRVADLTEAVRQVGDVVRTIGAGR